jgi:hypothetical protein
MMEGGLPPTARLLGIGFYVALAILLPTLGGRFLDGEFDSRPAFTLAGLIFGLIIALYGGYRQLMEVLDEINRRRTEDKRE